ncbi:MULTISPECIES: hypothetical protein [unclassified Labrenzia]|uniref:hypothetical protein n=1 Tax=unclassified Labrenzia TaxID=2648686 RepID=UPI0004BA8157|nr:MULTISPECIES: hypothetical protein [unclassified Labrenzia]
MLHKETGEIHEIDANDIYWEPVSSSEEGMGPSTLWKADWDDGDLGNISWEMSEYPVGFFSDPKVDTNGHKLLEDISVEIVHEPEPEEEFDNDVDEVAVPETFEDAKTAMKDWFFENYEDPAQSLPHDSREGGYQWIYGGPTTPDEALQDNFSGDYPFEIIQEAAQEIVDEEGLFDWSPIADEEDYDFGDGPNENEESDDAETINQRLPLAEDLIFNEVSGAFDVVAREIAKPDLLGATLGQVYDAIEDVLANPSNGLNEQSFEIRKLRRTVAIYANDPQRVEMDFTSVHATLVRQIAVGELPPSKENEALINALREGAQGIRATDPSVAENREILQQQAQRELTDEDLQTITDAAPALEAISEGRLEEELREDILYLTREMRIGAPRLLGVTRDDAIIPAPDEAVRLFGRSARMLIFLRQAPELVEKVHNSSAFKAISIIAVLASLVSIAVTLF